MTTRNKTLFHSHESTRDFLYSKTDTDRLKEVKSHDIIDADQAVKSAHPEILSGKEFIDHALEQLGSAEQFSAMVIRIDQLMEKIESDPPARDHQAALDTASLLNELCRREGGLWGTLENGLFGGFFPDRNGSAGLELARNFQQQLKEKTGKTVTIGIAAYPTITYPRSEVIDNARKALDHATFFGANSFAAFDDVSLNISGDNFYEAGKISEAIHEFKMALELDPNNVNVHNSLGVCYGLQNRHDSAVAEFKKAIALDRGEYMALYNLGLIHLMVDQKDRALEFFLEADNISGDNYEVAFQTGKLYLENGEIERSRPYLERAVELEPTSGQTYRYLGNCYAAGHQPQEAIAAYNKAIKHNPQDAAAMSALGSIYDDQGENPEIAGMFLSESIALAPENGLFHHRLGRHYANQHRLDEALKEFVRAKSLGYDATEDIKAIKDRKKAKK